MWCLIWCLNETWKPARWRSWQSNLKNVVDTVEKTRIRDNVTRRCGGNVPHRRYWVFHLGATGDVAKRTNGTSWIRTTEKSWWRTTETLFGVSFETYLRCRGDVLMGRCHYVPLRRRHDTPIRRREDVPLRRRWVFHLRRTCDIVGTQRERRRYDVATTSCCQMGCYVKAQNGRLRLTSLKVFSYIIKVWDELIASIKTSALTW